MKIRYYEINNKYNNMKKNTENKNTFPDKVTLVFLTTIDPIVRHDKTSIVQCSFTNINYVIKY